MTKSKKQPAKQAAKNSAELSDAALSKASGGALNAYMTTDQKVARGGSIVTADPPGANTLNPSKTN